MNDFLIEGTVLKEYRGSGGAVFVPSGLTGIGAFAFSGCTSLTEVHLPEGLCEIGYCAFSNCTSLTGAHLPEGLYEIGDRAFEGCTSLTVISLPNDLAELGYDVFAGCASLREIVLPDDLAELSSGVFSGCISLVGVRLSSGLVELGCAAFSGCASLREIELPDELTRIGDRVFEGCTSLAAVGLPDGLIELGRDAFRGCASLREIDLPDELTRIGDRAFSYCTSLADVRFPDGLCGLGNRAFAGCASLAEVCFAGDLAGMDCFEFFSVAVFEGCTSLTAVRLPEGLLRLGPGIFSGCNSLTAISFPEDLYEIGDAAFRDCASLTEIYLPDGLKRVGRYAFGGCTSLTEVNLSEGLPEFGSSVFDGCSSLKVSESLSRFGYRIVGDAMFHDAVLESYCADDEVYSIPCEVKEVSRDAFAKCSNLKRIELQSPDTELGFRSVSTDSILEVVLHPDAPLIPFSAFKGRVAVKFDGKVIEGDKDAEGFAGALMLPNIAIRELPAKWKRFAAVGFMMMAARGDVISGDVGSGYMRYVKSQKKKLYDAMLDFPGVADYMVGEALIPMADLPTLIMAADEKGDAKLSAKLAEYGRGWRESGCRK